jgi:ABC-type nitrate/sulfonate/bicarbonate transport system permease component
MAGAGSMSTSSTQQAGVFLRFIPGKDIQIKLFTGLIILVIWQLGITYSDAPRFIAKPLNVFAVFPDVIVDNEFLDATKSTLLAVIKGLLISLVAGTVVGFAIGRLKVCERLLNVYINGFYTMPMVAALPLITVWFGYEEEARMATIIFASFFSITINAADGARSVPPEYLEVAHAYRASPRYIWFDITLFSSLPYLIAGIRLAAGRAVVGAVIAEFFISLEGLGMYILANTRSYAHNEAVVGVLVLAGFGLLFEWITKWVLATYYPWYRRANQ